MSKPSKLHLKIRSHSAFFSNADEQCVGSGVLLEYRGRFFVLSAGHILSTPFMLSLGLYTPKTPIPILRKWIHPNFDVGYIEVPKREVEFLRGDKSEPYKISGKRNAAIRPMTPTLAICGFPWETRDEKPDRIYLPVMFMTVALLHPEKWPSVYQEKYDQAFTTLIPYGPKWGGTFVDRDNPVAKPMKPFGFSGSGIWHFDPSTENSDLPVYGLIGIQHYYDEFYQVLVGTRIDLIADEIESQCNDAHTMPPA